MPFHNLKQNSEKGKNPFNANSKVPVAFFWVWYTFIYIYLFQYTILINSSIEVGPLWFQHSLSWYEPIWIHWISSKSATGNFLYQLWTFLGEERSFIETDWQWVLALSLRVVWFCSNDFPPPPTQCPSSLRNFPYLVFHFNLKRWAQAGLYSTRLPFGIYNAVVLKIKKENQNIPSSQGISSALLGCVKSNVEHQLMKQRGAERRGGKLEARSPNLQSLPPLQDLPSPQYLLLGLLPHPQAPVAPGAFRRSLRVSLESQSYEQCENLCSLSSWNSIHWSQERLKAKMVLRISSINLKKKKNLPDTFFSPWMDVDDNMPSGFQVTWTWSHTSHGSSVARTASPPPWPSQSQNQGLLQLLQGQGWGWGGVSGYGNERQRNFLLKFTWKIHDDNCNEFVFWKHHG